MKKDSKLVFLLGLLLLFVPLRANAALSLQGDVNDDGNVGITDVTLLINYVLSHNDISVNLQNADVNHDGVINIGDVTGLIKLVLSGETPQRTETFVIDGVSFTMVYVEGGTFTMGTNRYPRYGPAHEVTLSDYCIGLTEVTQAQWFAVMGANPSWFCSTEGYTDNLQRPVEEVSWYNCQDFVAKLNALTGRTFRLPTEAEWEFAARGGNKTHGYRYSGSNIIDEVGWYRGNLPSLEDGTEGYGTQPVGSLKPNELGLYDMTGNVNEWCYDRHEYGYPSEPQVNPTGPETGYERVIRGCSWGDDSELNLLVICHNGIDAYVKAINLGLRLALEL